MGEPMRPIALNLQSQLKALESILLDNRLIRTVLERASDLCLPNWYVGAGCVSQSVWNYLAGRDLSADIHDIDLVYYDGADLTEATESRRCDSARSLFAELPIRIDLKNEARVHIWHESHFGYPIKPYRSVEEAINSWPTTARWEQPHWNTTRSTSLKSSPSSPNTGRPRSLPK
ncbi:MAG: hypothetical protein C4519_10420 [Desulfobacteraceae bacterium]|nr:MAG: hypothetical protein C4519_10420 [Desulfobacteraceae bacterium]